MYSGLRRLEADGDSTWYWGDESQGGRRTYSYVLGRDAAECVLLRLEQEVPHCHPRGGI